MSRDPVARVYDRVARVYDLYDAPMDLIGGGRPEVRREGIWREISAVPDPGGGPTSTGPGPEASRT